MSDTNKEAIIGPDLEKVRDEKCFPIIKEIISLMPQKLFAPDDLGQKVHPLTAEICQKMVDQDLNIATEASYIPQILLEILGTLNKTVSECEVMVIDDSRYVEIAKKMLSLLSEHNVTLGTLTPEEKTKDFAPIATKLNALFIEEKLNKLEVKYVMDAIFSAFKDVVNRTNLAIEASTRRAEAKLFGIEDMDDLTLKTLDDVLTK